MIIIANTYKVKEGMRDALVREILDLKMPERFRTQPGCVLFSYSMPIDEENILALVDVWADETSYEAHKTCAPAADWGKLREKYGISMASNQRFTGEKF